MRFGNLLLCFVVFLNPLINFHFTLATFDEFRRIKDADEIKPIITLPYGMICNPAFPEVYWERLLSGIRVDTGTADILFELRRLQVGVQDLLIVNFVARPIDVTKVDVDEIKVSIFPQQVAELWQDFLSRKGCLYKSIFILGLKTGEDFKPYSILHIDKKELEVIAAYLLRGWSGVTGEGLGTDMLSSCKLIAETLNIGIRLNFISKQELIKHSLNKHDFVVFFEALGKKMLACNEETVVLNGREMQRFSPEEIQALGKTIMDKFLPWLSSSSSAVIYRVAYMGYIRMLRD